MTETGIYNDIATRTNGDIYIGVVGPVRTGKSTLIKRFTENLILPNIESESTRERARDEMPQSASGRTVMTTEPKFVPENAAKIPLGDGAECRVKLIDCVGYLVPGAMGLIEDGSPRMVMTPWSEAPLPFEQAAETGTRKVIAEHSTIGIVVTTDGSIGELPREAYIDAEKRVILELKELNKPFVVVLNCDNPRSNEAQALAKELEQEYDVPVLPLSCMELGEKDIKDILRSVLYEFPIREVRFVLPQWLEVLDDGDALKKDIYTEIDQRVNALRRVGEIPEAADAFGKDGDISARLERLDLGSGGAKIDIKIPERIFYNILGEKSGFEIENERALL
ncbi:MAG: 50S ribosome-binding GTPase, partial [Clostridia bacterium]|nr:50S ribosome-binding GTPase [Clostridia bacterium]